jgi:hypothetical protein
MGFLDFMCDIADAVAVGAQEFVDVCHEADGAPRLGVPQAGPYTGGRGWTLPQPVSPAVSPAVSALSPPAPSHQPPVQRGTRFYHGGPLVAVMDILRNNRVKLGRSTPKGFYVMSDIDPALTYAGRDGGVVELYIPLSVTLLRSYQTQAFYKPMPDAVIGKYYHITGMRPVRVLDANKQQVALAA